jgi:hypothetical protein
MLYISPNVEQEAIRELSIKKHHLLLELRNYEAGAQRKSQIVKESVDVLSLDSTKTVGAIPVKDFTCISCSSSVGVLLT